MTILGIVVIWVGIVFYLIGTLGVFRLPDVYSRLHATGVMSNFGLTFVALGAALVVPVLWIKLLALVILVLLTAPVASHTIALAAYQMGIMPAHQPPAANRGNDNEQAQE